MSLPKWVVRLLSVLVLGTALHAQKDASRLAAEVDRHYNALRSMRVEFTQIYSGPGIERTESGILLLKKGGKMRWEYTDPKQKLFVSDGKRAWFYIPGERQAQTTALKQLDDIRSPLRYLLGHTKLAKEFRGLSMAPDVAPTSSGGIVLRGIPTSAADQISQTLIEISPDSRIVRIVIDESGGSRTEFLFQNEQQNLPASDSRFEFSPPPGVEILRRESLTSP